MVRISANRHIELWDMKAPLWGYLGNSIFSSAAERALSARNLPELQAECHWHLTSMEVSYLDANSSNSLISWLNSSSFNADAI
jgi:hypothetical protein